MISREEIKALRRNPKLEGFSDEEIVTEYHIRRNERLDYDWTNRNLALEYQNAFIELEVVRRRLGRIERWIDSREGIVVPQVVYKDANN